MACTAPRRRCRRSRRPSRSVQTARRATSDPRCRRAHPNCATRGCIAFAERLDDLCADQASGSDDEYLAHTAPLFCRSLPERCGTDAAFASPLKRPLAFAGRVSSNPAPHPSAILDVVLAEGFAEARLLERYDAQFIDAQGTITRINGQALPSASARPIVDDGQGQIHRIARPCVRAGDDEARRLPGRIERRAPEHKPSRRGRGERTTSDRERKAAHRMSPTAIQTGRHGMSQSSPTPTRNTTANWTGGGMFARIGVLRDAIPNIPSRSEHNAAGARPRSALSRAAERSAARSLVAGVHAWIASRAAFHWSSPHRRNS